MKNPGLLYAFLLFVPFSFVFADEPEPVKIWDEARHNAFTDITRFNGKFYCAFREGFGHVPGKKTGQGDGTIRLLISDDGSKWKSAAVFKKKKYDFRDPKLSVTPDGRLMVLMGGSVYTDGVLTSRRPHVSFSDKNGVNFMEPIPVRIAPAAATENDWIWRVTWYLGTGYGILYQPSPVKGKDWKLILLRTSNGIDYAMVSRLNVSGHPNEATIRFAPGTGEMNVLVRREAEGKEAMFGRSYHPFTQWTWTNTRQSIGGPNFIFLPNGKILAGGRVDQKTVLGTLDEEGKFEPRKILPSAGDNSYPGFCLDGNNLYVSYYSTHVNNKTSIFIIKYRVDELQKSL